jgi:hypothetical protein
VEHTVHPSAIYADYLVDYTIHFSLMYRHVLIEETPLHWFTAPSYLNLILSSRYVDVHASTATHLHRDEHFGHNDDSRT